MPTDTTNTAPTKSDAPKPEPTCEPYDPCDLESRSSKRKKAAIAAAFNSFESSRKFLTRTQVSSSERLIRFYEGVTASLQTECFEAAFRQARHAFGKVARYGLDDEIRKGIEEEQKLQDRLLILQAHHNLAVMHHRKWLDVTSQQLDPAPTPKPDEPQANDSSESLRLSLFRELLGIKAQSSKKGTSKEPSPEQLERDAHNAYRTAHRHYETVLSVGIVPNGDENNKHAEGKAEEKAEKKNEDQAKNDTNNTTTEPIQETLFPSFWSERGSTLQSNFLALFLASAFGLLELIVQGR